MEGKTETDPHYQELAERYAMRQFCIKALRTIVEQYLDVIEQDETFVSPKGETKKEVMHDYELEMRRLLHLFDKVDPR